MSRVGKKIINLPELVNVIQNGQQVSVSGPNGKLEKYIPQDIKIIISSNQITVKPETNTHQNYKD
jgi:ribosomal protein L6P/L9E